jgi:hypothetical protein
MILKAIALVEKWPPMLMTEVDDPWISSNNFVLIQYLHIEVTNH